MNNSDSSDYVISRISSAEIMLREAREPKQAIEIADVAEAARIYAKRARAAVPVINHAAALKISAERKAGELLRQMELKPGPKPNNSATLSTLGISLTQSARWQQAASVPEKDFRDYLQKANEAGEEITSAGVYKLAKQKVEEDKRHKAKWSDREKELHDRLKAGETVVLNMKTDLKLQEWAEANGLFIRIDRMTEWGNPFLADEDGTRDEVCGWFEEHYLPFKFSLLKKVPELKGKALGCWCKPDRCHGDCLAHLANQ
jgi:hypothetical protein